MQSQTFAHSSVRAQRKALRAGAVETTECVFASESAVIQVVISTFINI